MLLHTIAIASMFAGGFAAGPVLELPWACGESFSCSQSNGGLASHTGFAQYAWDFGMALGTDIHAVRGGTVLRLKMNSQSGGCSSDFAADGNYVVLEHDDGTASLYLHLEGNSSNLQLNDVVAEGQIVGRVGLTGWTCGPHLHFQTQEVCQSWWCQSVPSEFYGVGVIEYPDAGQSENCGPCTATLAGADLTISESQVQCFDRLTKYWWDAGAGLDGHHWYTLSADAPQPETIGRWRFNVDVPGNYEVEVHVPNADAQATGASYRVHHNNTVDEINVNQSAQKGWQLLGSYYFSGNGDEFIELPDNTGEGGIPLAYDSVRFGFVEGGDGDGDPTGDGDGDPSGDGDGEPTSTSGDGDGDECPLGQIGCMCTDGGGCDPGGICFDGVCIPEGEQPGGGSGDGDGDGGDGDGDTNGSTSGGETGSNSPDGLDYRGEQGCACTTDPEENSDGVGWGWLALLGLGLVTRRRRTAA